MVYLNTKKNNKFCLSIKLEDDKLQEISHYFNLWFSNVMKRKIEAMLIEQKIFKMNSLHIVCAKIRAQCVWHNHYMPNAHLYTQQLSLHCTQCMLLFLTLIPHLLLIFKPNIDQTIPKSLHAVLLFSDHNI